MRIKKKTLWSQENVSVIKCLLHKHEDLRSCPQHPCEKSCVDYAYGPVMRRQRQDSWGLMAIQSIQTGGLQI